MGRMNEHVGIRKHEGSKYIRQINSCVDEGQVEVDVYSVLVAFNVTNPATAHAAKKLLCAGIRGKGSVVDDLRGAIAALHRSVEIEGKDGPDSTNRAALSYTMEINSDEQVHTSLQSKWCSGCLGSTVHHTCGIDPAPRPSQLGPRGDQEDYGEQLRELAQGLTALGIEPQGSEEAVHTALRVLGAEPRIVPTQTEHQRRVEHMMVGFGQEVPEKPTVRDRETRVLRARLILEEALETIQDGLRVSVSTSKHNFRSDDVEQVELDFDELDFAAMTGPPDMTELADGCADVSVVTIGTLSAFGIKDRPLLEEVDTNNMEKVNTGQRDEHGKWIKHPDHKPPRIEKVLKDQGLDVASMPF